MELRKIVKKQKSFFESGVSRDLAYRRSALQSLKREIERNEDAILNALQRDLGKSPFEAYETEIGIVLSEISYMLRHLNRLAAPERVRTPLTNFPGKSAVYREPYGVVLIMSPWNYPFQLTMLPLVGALAAGNCAVVKPSAYSPSVSSVIRRLLQGIFAESYVYAVTGGREVNQELLEQRYDYIFFTGGKTVGKLVMESAARNLTPLTLELGGKSPCVVDETADVPLAARRIVWGKFLNCGQTCVAPDYILVHHRVKERFLEAAVKNIEALYGSSPLESRDYGKIVNEKHFDRLMAMLEDKQPYYSCGADRESLRLGPVILTGEECSGRVMEEEIFGPIMPVVGFEDLTRVKEQINAGPRPLALYLFTRRKETEKYVIGNIPFGGGCINDTVMHLASDRLPFGGIGESGMGNYHGKYSFRTFSHEKSILKKSLLIDVPLRYPPFPDDLKWLKMFFK